MPAIMKYLITGGAGFIGCHAASRFLRQGHQVVVLDNLSRKGTEHNLEWLKKSEGLKEFVQADIRSPEKMREIFAEHADAAVVIHLAAQVTVTESVRDPRTDFDINCFGTFNVLEAIRLSGGKPVVLYSSTNKVYGHLEHLKTEVTGDRCRLVDLPQGVDEHERLEFHSPYGCSKGAGDMYMLDYARIYGMKTVVFRQSCIYGTRQFGYEDQGWLAWFIIAALSNRQITIFGDGKQVRDALWIDDLLNLYETAIAKIDKAQGQEFNVGGGPGTTISLLELLDWIGKRLGKKLELKWSEPRPGDQRVFVANTAKAERLLGWKPKVSVAEGLDKLFDWVQRSEECRARPA
jgi:CDP-paratose 2-epimerase